MTNSHTRTDVSGSACDGLHSIHGADALEHATSTLRPARVAAGGLVPWRGGLPGRLSQEHWTGRTLGSARTLVKMPANPMLEVDATEIGKTVGTAAVKGAGKAGVIAGKGAGKAGVAVGKAGKRAAIEGKAAYQKRQDERKNVSTCCPDTGDLRFRCAHCPHVARLRQSDANHQSDVQQRVGRQRR